MIWLWEAFGLYSQFVMLSGGQTIFSTPYFQFEKRFDFLFVYVMNTCDYFYVFAFLASWKTAYIVMEFYYQISLWESCSFSCQVVRILAKNSLPPDDCPCDLIYRLLIWCCGVCSDRYWLFMCTMWLTAVLLRSGVQLYRYPIFHRQMSPKCEQ